MRHRSRIATIYLLGFFIDLVNMFIANVAYPDIGRAFGASVAALTWVGNAYMLGLTMIIPLSVWLAGRYGERRLVLVSLSVFGSASLMAGFAGSIGTLIGWRFVQGLAGGLLIPIGQALAYRLYPPAERARLTSLVMAVALIVPAASPALGGLLVDHVSWRWIFFANLPLVLPTFFLASAWLGKDPPRGEKTPLDAFGFVSGASAIVALLVALTLLGTAGSVATGLVWLVVATALVIVYARDALRRKHPLLDIHLIRDKLLRTSMLVYLFVPGVFMGTSMAATLLLQGPFGMTATQTGALMLPWAMASFAAIATTRAGFNRIGPKTLFFAGVLMQSAGITLMSTLTPGVHIAYLVAAYALMGFGGSLCSSTAQSAAFLDIAPEDMAHASALWNINRQIGFCLGVAAIGMLLSTLLGMSDTPLSAHRTCFIVAALLTLLPLPLVRRIRTEDVMPLLHPTPSRQHHD